ncbi:MAG: FAD-dependent monooxygenase [Hyphomicrobium sp.]
MSLAAGPIAIAGGGIGGLATALALAKRGLPSVICERRVAFSEDGAGVQIGPNGVKILQALGVSDLLRNAIAAPNALSVRNGLTGAELTRLPFGDWIAKRHGAPYWTAHRADLHAALLAAVEKQPLVEQRLEAEVTGWSETQNGIKAETANGDRIPASALIAADGLWSRLRHEVCDAPPPKPVGKSAYRCIVSVARIPAGLAANDVHIWLAPDAHAVHYPVRSGREIALVLIVDDADAVTQWSAESTPDLSNGAAARFAPTLRALLATGDGWRKWSLYSAAPLKSWSRGSVALLGDAAHPVLPFLAQGAVLALEDATALANNIAKQPDDITGALSNYALTRRPRANRIAAAAARNGRIYHLGGPMALARNATLMAAPPARLMATYDWLYGWEV